MHINEQRRIKAIEDCNSRLKENNQKILILEWNNENIILSNNIIIKHRKKIYNFVNRCRSKNTIGMIDFLYEDINNLESKLKELRKQNASKAGKKCQKIYGSKIKKNLNNGVPWNKGLTKETDLRIKSSWNKGLTKETDLRIRKLSKNRIGSKNPMYGKKFSTEYKRKKSELMKNKIKNGLFTPNIHNSRTHWQVMYNGKKYRSSWEAVFHHINPICEYEKIRIEYVFKNKKRIYITDFVDEKNKKIFEIKPKEHTINNLFKTKEKYLIDWCRKNGYQYQLINQKYFYKNYNKIDFNMFDLKIKKQMDKIYESEKNKKNRKT